MVVVVIISTQQQSHLAGAATFPGTKIMQNIAISRGAADVTVAVDVAVAVAVSMSVSDRQQWQK